MYQGITPLQKAQEAIRLAERVVLGSLYEDEARLVQGKFKDLNFYLDLIIARTNKQENK